MSTDNQAIFTAAGAGDRTAVLSDYTKIVTMTMAAGVTVSATFQIPAGAVLRSFISDVPTAFSGSPTNINASLGTAAAGAQIVAATDIKAQGHTTLTTVSTFDNVGYAASAVQTVYLQLAAVGGTNPAGTAYIRVGYSVPA